MALEKSPAHEHKLFFMDTTSLFATKDLPFWACDACKRTSKEMKVTHSYRCMKCDFDLCKECTEPITSSYHIHKLVVSKSAYPSGKWICDNCMASYKSQGPLCRHCESGCNFDLCFGCTKDHKSFAHPHYLLKANPKINYPYSSGWQCEMCHTVYDNDSEEKPYNCKQCQFDLCLKCLEATIEIQPNIVKVDKSVEDGHCSHHHPDDTKQTDGEPLAQVFISYNWNIQDKVLELKKRLESRNIKCWMDTGNMVGGDDLKKEIDKGMRSSKIVISCVTKAYSQSNACQQEVALADVLKKPILPVLFESVTWPPEGPMAMPFAPLIYVSLESGMTNENLDKVVKTIKSRTGMKG